MLDYHPTPFCFAAKVHGSFLAGNLIPMHIPVVVGSWAGSSAFSSAQFKFKEELPPMVIGDRLRALREQKKL